MKIRYSEADQAEWRPAFQVQLDGDSQTGQYHPDQLGDLGVSVADTKLAIANPGDWITCPREEPAKPGCEGCRDQKCSPGRHCTICNAWIGVDGPREEPRPSTQSCPCCVRLTEQRDALLEACKHGVKWCADCGGSGQSLLGHDYCTACAPMRDAITLAEPKKGIEVP